MDSSSGYDPFLNLLSIEKLDERLKRAADMEMRKIVEDEIVGNTKPREEWEAALRCYAYSVQMQLYDGPTYSTALFAEQMQFIMDNRNPDVLLVDSFRVIKIFVLLSDDAYKNLRHEIARYVVLENRMEYARFSIYNEETKRAVDQMLAEFGDSDQELADKVRMLIEENEKIEVENLVRQTKTRETEESILSAMK